MSTGRLMRVCDGLIVIVWVVTVSLLTPNFKFKHRVPRRSKQHRRKYREKAHIPPTESQRLESARKSISEMIN